MTLASRTPSELDTIAAIATPAGEGGIGIVRLSGPNAVSIASLFFEPRSGTPLQNQLSFTARMGKVVRPGSQGAGRTVDEALLLLMRAPKTYTREDMVEIQAHGGAVVLNAILDVALSCGARLAEPGEFTKRAFLSGRIDLTQAEAVLDMIHAKSEAARAFAAAQLGGALSEKIGGFRDVLIDILSNLEADIDFPDDFTDPETRARLLLRLDGVLGGIARLLETSAVAFVAKRGVRAVIWGRPNVGKSSLLNALSRKNRVIVTPYPGTTRDVVEEEISIDGFPVRLVDTAGVQETGDPIEREGVARSRLAVLAADVVLHVLDASQPLADGEETLLEVSAARPRILVLNKSDLPGVLDVSRLGEGAPVVRVSCLAEGGLRPLEEALSRLLGSGRADHSDEAVLGTVRQKDALDKVRLELLEARTALESKQSPEFPAADLRRALAGLAEITGEITNEDILDRLFSQFCIGK